MTPSRRRVWLAALTAPVLTAVASGAALVIADGPPSEPTVFAAVIIAAWLLTLGFGNLLTHNLGLTLRSPRYVTAVAFLAGAGIGFIFIVGRTVTLQIKLAITAGTGGVLAATAVLFIVMSGLWRKPTPVAGRGIDIR